MRLTQREALVGALEEPVPGAKLQFHARTEMAAFWYGTTSLAGNGA